jgi:hypothetical protein
VVQNSIRIPFALSASEGNLSSVGRIFQDGYDAAELIGGVCWAGPEILTKIQFSPEVNGLSSGLPDLVNAAIMVSESEEVLG